MGLQELCPLLGMLRKVWRGSCIDNDVVRLYKKYRGRSGFGEISGLSLDMFSLRLPWDNQVETADKKRPGGRGQVRKEWAVISTPGMVQVVGADELLFGEQVGESPGWSQQFWHSGAGRGAGVGDQEEQTTKAKQPWEASEELRGRVGEQCVQTAEQTGDPTVDLPLEVISDLVEGWFCRIPRTPMGNPRASWGKEEEMVSKKDGAKEE